MPECLMEEVTPLEPVQLEPFQHQVGGHTVILHYDEETVCKPLNKREQHFYVTLPEELKEFTAEYRGVIDVHFQEHEDGFISLIGYRHTSPVRLLKPDSGSSSPVSSGSDGESSSEQTHPSSNKKGSTIRFLRSGSIEVCTKTDTIFQSLDSGKQASHSPWGLRCHKMLLNKWRTQGQSSDTSKFMLLKNMAAQFKRPCVLDLKMGTRQYGDGVSELKMKQQTEKSLQSTTAKLGVRLCGMQVFQVNSDTFISQDKYQGRQLSLEGFKNSICQFLHNGQTVRLDIVNNILQKLTKLHDVVEGLDSFRFYTSSLLIMYDGGQLELTNGNEGSSSDLNSSERVVVCMIDFAHSTHIGFAGDHIVHEGPDKGYMLGLISLIKIFQEVYDQYKV